MGIGRRGIREFRRAHPDPDVVPDTDPKATVTHQTEMKTVRNQQRGGVVRRSTRRES